MPGPDRKRRSFVAGMIAAGLFPKPTWAEAGSPSYLSAGRRQDGRYVLCGLDESGQISFELDLPARGHAAAAHPDKPLAVAFARRPGTYALVIDCRTGQAIARLRARTGRHFYGHGTFSKDGDLLFTTENDFSAARGVVGIWDAAQGFRRIGEFASGGTGPHDIRLLPDGRTLAIANGGIETHPDTGRTKLNIATMRPNLSYADLGGTLLETVELGAEFRKNSIRHLAVARDGTVGFAMQWQGDLGARPPLLGLSQRGARPDLLCAPDDQADQMAGYAGSIAISGGADLVAITSPRGGACQVFDRGSRALADEVRLDDVCGVAPAHQGFRLTNGLGQIWDLPHQGATLQARHPLQWDNHLVRI